MNHVAYKNIEKLLKTRNVYSLRITHLANLRAETFIAFGKMQSSKIMRPNQSEMGAVVQKLQAYDMEIKRYSDFVQALNVLIINEAKPGIFANINNMMSGAAEAEKILLDVECDLQKVDPETIIAITLVSDVYRYLPAMFPGRDLLGDAVSMFDAARKSYMTETNLCPEVTSNVPPAAVEAVKQTPSGIVLES